MSARGGGATVTCTSQKRKIICFARRRGGAKSRKKESLCYGMTSFTLWKREESAVRPETSRENEVTRKDPFSHCSSGVRLR